VTQQLAIVSAHKKHKPTDLCIPLQPSDNRACRRTWSCLPCSGIPYPRCSCAGRYRIGR